MMPESLEPVPSQLLSLIILLLDWCPQFSERIPVFCKAVSREVALVSLYCPMVKCVTYPELRGGLWNDNPMSM